MVTPKEGIFQAQLKNGVEARYTIFSAGAEKDGTCPSLGGGGKGGLKPPFIDLEKSLQRRGFSLY